MAYKNGKVRLADVQLVLDQAAKLGITMDNPITCRQVRKEILPELPLDYKTVKRILKEHKLLMVHDMAGID